MSWSGWYLRNSSISAILRSVIGVVTPFRLLVVLLLEGNAPVTFSVNHRPDSTGFYTLPGTLTWSTVENLGPGLGKTLLYRCQHKVHLQGVAQLPAHHVAGVPVQQRHQIQPAPREPDVGDVRAPHLVGSRDHHTPQQGRVDTVVLVASAQVAAGRHRLQAHLAHVAWDGLAINVKATATQRGSNPSRTVVRMFGEDFVNGPFECQLLP